MAKVADFGWRPDIEPEEWTGTTQYMAPEFSEILLSGTNQVDHAVVTEEGIPPVESSDASNSGKRASMEEEPEGEYIEVCDTNAIHRTARLSTRRIFRPGN